MKRKTIISIACTLCWLLAAYAAYAAIFFGWLTATPLSKAQLSQTQYRAEIWSAVFSISLIAAASLGFWRLRLAGFFKLKRKPIQAPEPTIMDGTP